MPKNIIFCADGTWNGPGGNGQLPGDPSDDAGELGSNELSGDELTNVVKLYSRLSGIPTAETKALHDEQEKIFDTGGPAVQITKYMHGVGDSRNLAIKVLGGVFGVGVIARIVRGYTFISRHYQPGDAIHIVGFSRGAYTARALAGMISRVGLLNTRRYNVNDKEQAYKLGEAAWYLSKGISITGNSEVSGFFNRMIDFVETKLGRAKLDSDDLIPNVPIKSVAVWDTVGSLGVPLYLRGGRMDVYRFADAKLSDKVEFGFHAMAIDEQRADFPVTPWERRAGVEQVWFVGAHADVGGGYKQDESFLSDATLHWMMKKLDGVGVKFTGSIESLALPKLVVQKIHTPWLQAPFNFLAKSDRAPHVEDAFHSSVIARWKGSAEYRPKALQFINEANIDRLTIG